MAGLLAIRNVNVNTCHCCVTLLLRTAFMRQHLFFICLLCLLSCVAPLQLWAQKPCVLMIRPVDTTANLPDAFSLSSRFSSKEACLQYIKGLPDLLKSKGYISASVDAVTEDSNGVTIDLFAGKRYQWNHLRFDSSALVVLNALHADMNAFIGQPFSQEKADAIYGKILDFCQNNGYPFAKVGIDSLRIEDSLIDGVFTLEKGAPYYIDSIHVWGKTKLSQEFVHRYLNMAPHQLYNQTKLDDINKRLAELTYVQPTQPWALTMLNDKAILNLYLEPKHTNQVDAIIGFLPANEQTGGKLLVTGQATINLKNAFGTGETIGVDWQQLQAKSPRLNLLFQRPYLFHSPLGIDFNFELYKRDSFFVNINAQLGLSYTFSPRQKGTLFLQSSSSRLLSIDTNVIIITKALPETGDINSLNLGLAYQFSNTDYVFNPRRGNEVSWQVSAGSRQVEKNTTITGIKNPDFNYGSLYDTVQLKSYRLRVQGNASHYIPLGKQATLKTALNAGLLQSPDYYINELFQLGGFRLLRGFNEESIYANRYAVGTAEYRYLLAQNSYFYSFVDGGYAHYQSSATAFAHSYIGAGFGLAFETKSGIFNISYATGKRDDAKLDLRQSKIHLGFASVF